MKKLNLKKLFTYLLPILLFAAISMVYFYPVLQGFKVKQTDIKQHKGMAHEITSHREKFDEEPLWIGNMFAGMPAYQVSNVKYSWNIMPVLRNIILLWLPHPMGILFAYLIGFFIFSLSLKIDPLISLVGSIAYAFSTYFIIIIEAGHNTKALAIAFLPPMIGGIISILRGRLWIGALLTIVFLGLEIYANHLQITYYSIFIILAIVIVEFIHQFKESNLKVFFKRLGILAAAVIIGVLPNIGNLITTYEYSKASTRSPSELTIAADGKTNDAVRSTGLDKDYITQWSYGIEESLTLLFPNAKGGKSGAILGDQEEIERLRKENPQFFNFLVKEYQENQNIINTYWGNQPFTSGSVYIGIIICFLAFLALFFVKDRLILSLGVVALLTLFLSWGKNMMWLTELFIDHLPLYNKFRAVSMILVVVEFVLPVFAILFISKLVAAKEEILVQKKKLIIISSTFIGIILLFWLSPQSFFTFLSGKEQTMFNSLLQLNSGASNYINSNLVQLENYRIELFKSDILRGLQFLLLSIALLGLFLYNKIHKNVLILGLGGLIFMDLWTTDKGYINNELTPNTSKSANNHYVMYQRPSQNKAPYVASLIDKGILANEVGKNPDIQFNIDAEITKQKQIKSRLEPSRIESIQFMELMRGTHYRVLNTAKKLDEDAETAYFHKTLGGYHGAKMKKYQELVDFELGVEHFQLRKAFLQGGTDLVRSMLPKMNVTNMLNAKYIIGAIKVKGGQSLTFIENNYALGNAWFVNEVIWANNADEEITLIQNLNPSDKVIIRNEYKNQVSGSFNRVSSSNISLRSYLPNELVYDYSVETNQIAVFSEIYYKSGWNAYINDQKVPYFKANYILRGIVVPKGSGQLVFKFEPVTFAIGETLTLISSVLILLLIVGVGYKKYKSSTD